PPTDMLANTSPVRTDPAPQPNLVGLQQSAHGKLFAGHSSSQSIILMERQTKSSGGSTPSSLSYLNIADFAIVIFGAPKVHFWRRILHFQCCQRQLSS